MDKKLKSFEVSIMIDNEYNVIGCMKEENQHFIGSKCYEAFDFINKEKFIWIIDQTRHNKNKQQISFDTTDGRQVRIMTTPLFSPSIAGVNCLICLRKKCVSLIDVLDGDKPIEKTQYMAIMNMVRLVPVSAIALDPNENFKYLEWNKWTEQLTGIKRKDVIGKSCFDLFNLKQAQRYYKEDMEAIESREVIIEKNQFDFLSCCETEPKYLRTYRMPIYNTNNEPMLLVVIIVDITNSILEEKNLLQTEKLSLMGQLSSGVAHNIGNQLTTINGALSVIKLLDKEQEYAKYINCIKKAIDNSAELIHQLLDFGRKNDFNQEEMNVHDIIKATIEMVQYSFKKNIIIETKLDANWPYVKGNESRIQNTILNMLINARDAMPKGGVIRVITHDDEDNETICIHIEDEGEGMEQAVANKVFDPFFTTKQAGKGTGMGLSTAYGNIKQMNGSINVNSCIGIGTVFTIQLPIVKDVKVS